MRIGFVLDDDLSSPNGVQQVVSALSSWMAIAGHESLFFVSQDSKVESGLETGRNGRVYELARSVRLPFNGNWISTAVVPRHIDRRTTQAIRSCDVLHVQAPFGPLVGHRVIRRAAPHTKVVASFHMAPSSGKVVRAARVLSRVLASSIRRVDSITCDSPVSRDLLDATWRRESVVIPNPAPLVDVWQADSPPTETPSRVRIIFVGRLVPRKGCSYLLSAVGLLDSGIRGSIEVEILGSGPQGRSLARQARALGLQDTVSFRGEVSEAEKYSALRGAELAVFPSTRAESFGMVLLEAVRAKTPVLAFDNPGYAFVLRNAPGSLVSVGDVPELSERIHALCTNSGERARLLEAQTAVLGDYDIDQIGEAYLSAYSQV